MATEKVEQALLNVENTVLASFKAATRSSRRQRNLTILASVLRKRVLDGEKSFHIPSIADECSKLGGPSEQTIRNKPGEDFRQLIDAYAAINDGSTRMRSSTASYADELLRRVMASIPDPQLRAELGMELAEKRSLQRQLDILRGTAAQGMIIRVASGPAPVADASVSSGVSPTPFSEVELNAVRSFLDPKHLEDNGWRVANDGRMLTDSGREIARFGFVSVLQRVLQSAV